MSPPRCEICTYRQPEPKPCERVYHHHYSSREIRIMQGKEYSSRNPHFMCPTCECFHPIRPIDGLNVCLGTNQLHEFHSPQEPGVLCPPDKIHVDWVTIPNATIPTLETAWQIDYAKYKTPMRVLLVAGLHDVMNGVPVDNITNSILNFKNVVDDQNKMHPAVKNDLVVATLMNPPKATWFKDNGAPPRNHTNYLEQIMAINKWIIEFNESYGNVTPRLHRFGVRCGRKFSHGEYVPLQAHQMNKWRQSEEIAERFHLNDYWRVKLGATVVKHFESEFELKGRL